MRRAPPARHSAAMTESSSTAPPPFAPPEPPPQTPPSPPYAGPPRRPIYRDPDDKVIGGVCAAAGRYTDTDPVLWRVAVAVLAVFGGAGLAIYVLGWLLIPNRAAGESLLESSLRRRGRPWSAGAVLVLALFALIILGGFDGEAVAALGVLGLIGYLVYRDRQNPAGPGVATGYPPPPAASFEAAEDVAPDAGPEPWGAWGAPPAVRPSRPRSALGLATLSIAALVTGCLVWAGAAGAEELTPARIAAVALLVVGAGLVVGAFRGRARWLIAVGVVLSLVLAGTAGAQAAGVSLEGGIGERTWVVPTGQPQQSYTLGVGEATLDLTALPPDGAHVVVRSAVSLGHLIVLVPADLAVRVHATVQIGDITEFGTSLVSDSDKVERTRSYGPPGDPRVEVEAVVGTGQIEVRRG